MPQVGQKQTITQEEVNRQINAHREILAEKYPPPKYYDPAFNMVRVADFPIYTHFQGMAFPNGAVPNPYQEIPRMPPMQYEQPMPPQFQMGGQYPDFTRQPMPNRTDEMTDVPAVPVGFLHSILF